MNFYTYLNIYAKCVCILEVYTDHDKVDLLPPSAFETHTEDAAWKELARATNEVMQLKLENQKLRYILPLLSSVIDDMILMKTDSEIVKLFIYCPLITVIYASY